MNKKRTMLSVMLMLALVAGLVSPQAQTTALAEDIQILTIENQAFYDALKMSLADSDNGSGAQAALKSSDDGKRQLTVDMERVKLIELKLSKSITGDNFKNTLEALLRRCVNMEIFRLKSCNLAGIDLTILNDLQKLRNLYLADCGLDKVPELTLPKLQTLCLAENDLSAEGACDHLAKEHFPAMENLFLDATQISDIAFLRNLGKLNQLYLADNRLTDEDIATLVGMSNLSGLTMINLGLKTHKDWDYSFSYNIYDTSGNRFADLEGLASLVAHFPILKKLELSGLDITSIQPFNNVERKVQIIFEHNRIKDYTGLKDGNGFILFDQRITLSCDDVLGQEGEVPELLKRLLDEEDVLYSPVGSDGSPGLVYTGCHVSDDHTKFVIENEKAVINVKRGRLSGSQIKFKKKQIPAYTVPENLTAIEGDTLAAVVLPEGFSWKNPEQDVGAEGIHTFQAVYTPSDTDAYIIVDNIDIPVTVKASAAEPAPTSLPTLAPTSTPTPTLAPTLAPTSTSVPTHTPKPEETALPSMKPTLAPTETKVPVIASTPKPDESKMSGNQIEKRKDLSLLLATGKQKGINGIKLTWKKKNGCSGYEVYWSYCDGKQNYKKLKTVGSRGKRQCIHKKLKKNHAYKYYIATYIVKDGRKNYQSKSPVIHVAMKREKHTNAKRIKVNRGKVTLKGKKAFQIKARAVLENRKKKLLSHDRKFRYYVDNRDVATVNKKGKIQGKKRGTCSVYVTANNGVAKKIRVTVK